MSELAYASFKSCTIRVVPHAAQAYPTVGDWREGPEGDWTITVSALPDWRYALLVALHEMVEMGLCMHRGINEQAVTDFDVTYEAKRPEGDESEPGDDLAAPYRAEHQFATSIERQVADEIGVDWGMYELSVGALQ